MDDRETINQYLNDLSLFLAGLKRQDAYEVVKEIESHIYDSIEYSLESKDQVDVSAILKRFGSPRELAQQFVNHITCGSPPPKGMKAITTVKRGVTKSLLITLATFGFGTALAMFVLAISKLIMPENIGVWSDANGNSIVIAYSRHPFVSGEELFGLWLVPLSLGIALFLTYLTQRILGLLKQQSSRHWRLVQ